MGAQSLLHALELVGGGLPQQARHVHWVERLVRDVLRGHVAHVYRDIRQVSAHIDQAMSHGHLRWNAGDESTAALGGLAGSEQ